MESLIIGGQSRTVLAQAEKNTTLWIGHLPTDPNDHFAGQTFTCPSNGMLESIQLFAAAVHLPGEARLSVHRFDPVSKTWESSLGETRVMVNASDEQQWISFSLPLSLALNHGMVYGFKVSSLHGMLGLGEAVTGTTNPFPAGQEWNADSGEPEGHYFSYFSLAFKLIMRG